MSPSTLNWHEFLNLECLGAGQFNGLGIMNVDAGDGVQGLASMIGLSEQWRLLGVGEEYE